MCENGKFCDWSLDAWICTVDDYIHEARTHLMNARLYKTPGTEYIYNVHIQMAEDMVNLAEHYLNMIEKEKRTNGKVLPLPKRHG